MQKRHQPAIAFFAIGMIGLGVLALVYGDFAMGWQPVAAWVPGRTALAYGSGVLMLVCGAGLLLRASVAWAVRILFPYLVVWTLLKVPALFVAPLVEGVWLGLGELVVLLCGGWILFARFGELHEVVWLKWFASERSARAAQIAMGIWLVPIGLSHFFYTQATVDLIPKWMPFPTYFAWLTGAGHIAAGLALTFSVWPAIAAMAEAGMLTVITLLVWAPAIAAAPKGRLPWTAFFISWTISAAVWVMAQEIAARKCGRPAS